MLFREKVMSHNKVLGMMLSEIAAPNVVRIMKAGGFDFMFIDCEHGYFDFSEIAALAAVGNGYDMPVIIRVPGIDRGFITKILDIGCDGILVPMVSTEQEAKKIVQYAKYSPIGKRGISTMRPHTNYAPPALHDYMKQANERTIVCIQIETREGVKNAEKIAGVEGIDVLMVGPNDLVSDFGNPGDMKVPQLDEAIDHIIQVAKKQNKPCGMISSNIEFLKKYEKQGMTILSCNSETGMLMKAAKQIVSAF